MHRLTPPLSTEPDAQILALCDAQLDREQRLVDQMLETLRDVRAAFLRRDLSNLPSLQVRQRELLAAECEIVPQREKLRASLALLLNIAPEEVTLRRAALALPEPARGGLLQRRARLVERVRQCEQLSRHNADLLGYARGFLDCLFAGLTGTSGTQRYGPQGERRDVSYGSFLQARV